MSEITPITREEKLWNGEDLEPLTREEMYIKRIFDKTQTIPDKPLTRKEILMEKAGEGGGGDVTIKQLSVTANGTYSEKGTAYSPVNVAVPLAEKSVTENGVYNASADSVAGYSKVNVNVPLPDNAYLLKEASGSLVSFDDGADLPMPSFICNITAQQDLHGYDAPWVGGAGKNKLQNTETTTENNGITFTVNSDGSVKANGTATADAVLSIIVDTSKVYGDLYFVGCNGGSNNTYNVLMWDTTANARAKKWDGTTASTNSIDGTFQQVKIVQGNNVKFQLRVMNGQTVNNVIFQPMICLSTETDASFAPYSNICPISGHTGLDAWVRGKNLLPMTVDGIKAANTAGTWSGNSYTVNGVTLKIQTDYDSNVIGITVDTNGGTASTDVIFYLSADSNRGFSLLQGVSYIVTADGATNKVGVRIGDSTDAYVGMVKPNPLTFTADSSNTARIGVNNGLSISNVTIKPMIRLATETDSTFEPYNPNSQTIQVSWQTEAGEVFGGYVDLVSGELTVTDGYIASYNGETLPSTWISDRDVYTEGTSPTTGAEVVYKLANPQTYQLTPTQIKSLLGNNNAWCSTGDVNVDYFAKEV